MHNYIVCQVFRDSLKQHIIFKGIMFVDFVVHSWYPRIQIPKNIQQSYESFYIEMQQTSYQQNYFPMNQLNLDNPGTLNTTYKHHSMVLNDIIWCKLCGKLAKIKFVHIFLSAFLTFSIKKIPAMHFSYLPMILRMHFFLTYRNSAIKA